MEKTTKLLLFVHGYIHGRKSFLTNSRNGVDYAVATTEEKIFYIFFQDDFESASVQDILAREGVYYSFEKMCEEGEFVVIQKRRKEG